MSFWPVFGPLVLLKIKNGTKIMFLVICTKFKPKQLLKGLCLTGDHLPLLVLYYFNYFPYLYVHHIIVSRNGVSEALSDHSVPSVLPLFRYSVLPVSQFISRTAACIELKFGIKLEINKRKSSTEPEFEKRVLISSNRGLCNSRHSSPIGLVNNLYYS